MNSRYDLSDIGQRVQAPKQQYDLSEFDGMLASPTQVNSKGSDDSGSVDTLLGKMSNPTGNMKQNLASIDFELPTTPVERKVYDQKMHERLLGAAQQLANYPVKAINLVKKQPISEFSFAPNTQAAQRGALAGDIASFFTPGGAVTGVMKGLSYIPKIGEGINAFTKGVQATPWINSLMNVGKTAGEAGIYNAVQNQQDSGNAFLQGAGIGGGTQGAVNLLTTQNPLIRTLARLGAGYSVGYGFGHPYYGAAAASAFPQAAKLLGVTNRNSLSQDALDGLQYKDIARAKAASDRLGTTITPAQASGNYATAAYEGALKKSPEGAQLGYRLEQNQLRQQRNAINDMLDNIYKPTPQSEANINALYGKAGQANINPNVIDQMKQNPIVSSAFKTVKSDPAFTNIPENNYQYLAEVDRQLYRDYNAALGSRPNSAHAINGVKSSFNNFLKQANPDYESATAAAQPKMVRGGIESKFNKMDEDMTGKNFYSKFLNSRSSYQDILKNTKNFPEAQQAIKDMRQGWKNLSNIKTVSQSEAQAKSGLDQARDFWKATLGAMQKIAGAKSDVKGLKYAYSKDWDKDFNQIMQVSEQKQRNRELATLLSKVGMSYGLQAE